MLRYLTLNVITSKYSLPNRFTRNCSAPRTKIELELNHVKGCMTRRYKERFPVGGWIGS
jgi:hypothetical protein